VGGKQSLCECLDALYEQAADVKAELIVPFDKWTTDILELGSSYPDVRFVETELTSLSEDESARPRRHSQFDLRRAAGLLKARGKIIAMTEDQAVPAADWCKQILLAHDEMNTRGVIGGAIENKVDRIMNWAWYYCDFARYGLPFESRHADYVSDVNVSYKREALMSVKEVWESAFHETTVHWTLSRNGEELILDPRPVVFQNRPSTSLIDSLRERIAWGRAFADTRAAETGIMKRLLLAAGCAFLPFLLATRAVGHMIRHGRSGLFILKVLPLLFVLLIHWSLGEAIGYLNFNRRSDRQSVQRLKTSASSSL